MYCVYVHTYIIYSFLVSYQIWTKLSTNDTEGGGGGGGEEYHDYAILYIAKIIGIICYY